MKKVIGTVTILIALTASPVMSFEAAGSAFGNFSTAEALGMGAGRFGGGVGIADATSFFGSFTYGMSQYFDGRLKMGLIDPDGSDAEITFGADVKYQVWSLSDPTDRPIDLALGGMFEYVSYGGGDIWQIGGLAIASYPSKFSNGKRFIPYGRFNVRLESYDVKKGGSETELKLGVNGGVAFELIETLNAYLEFQIDGNDGLFLGIDYSVL